MSTSAELQPAWHIDSSAGNNRNNGLTFATAIRDDAERQRRMGPRPRWSAGLTQIYYYNNVPASDPVVLNGFRPAASTILVHGSATAGVGKAVTFPLSGTAQIDALVALNRTSSPQHSWEARCDALSSTWTTASTIGQRLRFTTGANVGATSWPILDLTAKSAKLCQVMFALTSSPQTLLSQSTKTPSVGEQFVIESLVAIPNFFVGIESADDRSVNARGEGLWIDSLDVGSGCLKVSCADVARFYGCIIRHENSTGGSQIGPGYLDIFSSRQTASSVGVSVNRNAIMRVFGGYADTTLIVREGGTFTSSSDFMIQGAQLLNSGRVFNFSGLAIFGASGPALLSQDHGVLQNESNLWGDGNSGVGLACTGNICTYKPANVPTITGTLGDFSVGGRTTVQAYDTELGVWTKPRATTYANLAASIASGGFDGTVIDQLTGGQLAKVVLT